MTTEILKCNNPLDVLYILFNYCFVNHNVPHEWSKSRITPILKPNKDKLNPLNYRGINLLPSVGKLYSALLTSRIT